MGFLLVALGLAVVLLAVLDVVWTAAAAGAGAGPPERTHLGPALAGRSGVGRRPDGPRHRFLTVAGIGLVVTIVVVWVALAWLGWWLVFSRRRGRRRQRVRPARGARGAGPVRGRQPVTLSIADLSAGSGTWQFAAIGATATGVVFVTLAVSYFVPVASALADARQLGAYVSSLGESPEDVLRQAWNDGSLRGLEPHLVNLTPMVHALAERYLTYPVLQYFHSNRERASPALGLVLLDEVVTLLRVAVDADVRPDPVTVEPLARAVGWYLDTVRGSLVTGPPEPIPPADLDALRQCGIPTVDDETFRAALEGERLRRCQLSQLLVDDGWLPQTRDRQHRRLGQKV